MRIGYFRRTGYLINYYLLGIDDKIKLQIVKSQIVVPATCNNSDDNSFTAPYKQVTLEQELGEISNSIYDN